MTIEERLAKVEQDVARLDRNSRRRTDIEDEVLRWARAYGLMVTRGVYEDNGSTVKAAPDDREALTKYYDSQIRRFAEQLVGLL